WAAVVRELVDNALDAGASHITVDLAWDRWTLRVADDGEGMSAADLEQAARCHTTSKVGATALPLATAFLGFRGEALHSLAQMGQLQIQSCGTQEPHGWTFIYHQDGTVASCSPCPLAQGTVVTVSDLFAPWPARRHSQSPLRHLRDVITMLQYQALTHPHVTWILRVDDKPKLQLWPGERAADVLSQILPRLHPQDLRQVQGAGITVLLALPDRYHRPQPDWIKVAINHRFVQAPDLEQCLVQSFRHCLPRHRHPVCLAFLQIDPQQVDWHRHPAKSQVHLLNQEQLQAQLQALMADSLQITSSHPSRRTTKLLQLREAQGSYPGADPSTCRSVGSSLRALAQLQNTYILAEHATGLWLVEQHVAHERIRYEELQQQWDLKNLEPPLVLSGLTEQQRETLARLGCDPEAFGEQIWLIRRIPNLLHSLEDQEQMALLTQLGDCPDLEAAQVMVACRTALRNGTPLTLAQMQDLLDRWQRSQNPYTCPHGRPIYLALSETDLGRYFRRRWSICEPGPGAHLSASKALGDRFADDLLNRVGESAH
ncbi:MAG: DNA mismatch repair endonuclease MutL, partial [Synechococcaceae cyanobacterium SM2_3_1]|nr:DNA mismatch repair endonuclease MutL [Synechococcaceae cyanobacterium SM2_3_1]